MSQARQRPDHGGLPNPICGMCGVRFGPEDAPDCSTLDGDGSPR